MDVNSNIGQSALNDFVAECDEITQRVNGHLGQIEAGNTSSEIIDDLYRSIHTLKGSSQLFGYSELGSLAHALETCLDPLRKRQVKPQPALIESLYQCVDLIEKVVRTIQGGKKISFRLELEQVIPLLIQKALNSFGADYSVQKDPLGYQEDHRMEVPMNSKPVLSPVNEPVAIPTVAVEAPVVEAAPVVPETTATSAPSPTSTIDSSGAEAVSTIRVPVNLLDKLMTLMGEMVLVRNQVLQYSNQRDDLEFLNLSQRLDIVTSELQGEVMKTRMQPIGNILTKFQRVVRDLSRDLGKKIDLALVGVETELDKTLLESIKDPLTHIVRNSCDHGIESIEDRKKAGKSETGHVTIRAYHEGGQVVVEISDDGKGLSKEKLIAKAIEKSLTTADKAAQLSDREIFNFIFAPGFSTAAKVTNVSGRGVGMDVVKSNIEKIGGQAELTSTLGKGMTVKLKIPLTLAIVPAMIIRCAGNRYAIPQVKLVELVRVENSGSGEKVEYLQGKPMFRLRGNLLPLVDLKQVLNLPTDKDAAKDSATNIVVLNSERQMFGLIVDEIQDTADIVVKPMSQFLKALTIYSGATVLGDGSVSLILDVIGLSNFTKIASEASAGKDTVRGTEGKNLSSDLQEYLLFKVNTSGKYAIPLNLVQRLEEFKASSIELSGEQRAVRYRGAVLPIISLNQYLKFPASQATRDMISVIVVKKGGRNYGVEVDDILDVAVLDANIDDSLRDRPGILGNIIFNDEIVVICDILNIVQSEANRMSLKMNTAGTNEKLVTDFDGNRKKCSILFAEDTAFFRKHVGSVLTQAGFTVTYACDGKEALELLESSEPNRFTLVLSDVEMPKMGGMELAKAVRTNAKFKHLPMIALTTKFSERHVKEGLQAGFDLYMEKMNAEQLITQLDKTAAKGRGA